MAGYLGQKPAVNGIYTVDELTSSGGNTYTLSRAPGSKNNIQVSAGGLVQYPSAYSVSGTTLTLSGVPSGQKVIIRHMGETILYPNLDDNIVTLDKLAGGTDGQIITYDASGDPVAVGPGTDGQVLTSTGAGSPPAFEALPAGGYTELGVTNTSSGSGSTIGSIPAAVKTLLIVTNKVSCTGAAELNLQLGDSGGIETSGYVATTHKGDHTTYSFYNDTAHFGLANGGGGADPFCTVMNLTRSASGVNDWIVTWITKQSTGAVNWGSGSKTLSGELTQIKLLTNGTFDAGNWNAYYQ